ncbi:TPA: DUF2314 domain-containing protein [Neisseria gonorrhoeae]
MMDDSVIYYVEQADEPVNRAGERARKTFKYFWRELFWERRRIISALDFAMVKVPFFQDGEDGEICEHMWIDDIYFDGLYIYGVLNNEPGGLTNVEQGESVCVPVGDISDWMFVCNGIPYGGFTIQAMRGQMTEEERTEHDTAWGIDFGDPGQVLPVYEEKEHPENLEEHPMCRNCIDDFRQQLSQNSDYLREQDEDGYTPLHHEAIAGNALMVQAMLEYGANPASKTSEGYTALDFARLTGWQNVADLLEPRH